MCFFVLFLHNLNTKARNKCVYTTTNDDKDNEWLPQCLILFSVYVILLLLPSFSPPSLVRFSILSIRCFGELCKRAYKEPATRKENADRQHLYVLYVHMRSLARAHVCFGSLNRLGWRSVYLIARRLWRPPSCKPKKEKHLHSLRVAKGAGIHFACSQSFAAPLCIIIIIIMMRVVERNIRLAFF